MNLNSKLDTGVAKALALSSLPKDGAAYELGFGSARNLFAMARLFPGNTLGYELNPEFLDRALRTIEGRRLGAKVIWGDVLDLEWKPNSISIVSIGTMIYWPKSVGHEFLKHMWKALKPFGVIHVEFATPEDCTLKSPFVEFTCLPYPESEYDHSYGHYCGCPCMRDHPGVIGASYWTENEVMNALSGLGEMRVIHKHLRQWGQKITITEDGEKSHETMFRSFFVVTVQKLS